MSEDLKEQVKKIVERRNLCSYMNDTKWNELRTAMMNDILKKYSIPYECEGDGVYCIYGYR